MSLDLKISVTNGAFAVGFIFIGMACGCPLIGLLSDRLGNRVQVVYCYALL